MGQSIGISLKRRNVLAGKLERKIRRFNKNLNLNWAAIELHLNIWKLRNNTYLDIGIKFEIVNEEIIIYLPFKITDELGFEDLGERICNNQNLLRAIFNNEYYSIPIGRNESLQLLKENTENSSFKTDNPLIFCILGKDDYSFVKFTRDTPSEICGTIIRITLTHLLHSIGQTDKQIWKSILNPFCNNLRKHENPYTCNNYNGFVCPLYIRFRLKLQQPFEFIQTRSVSNDFFQAAFSSKDIVDIRINELRNIPVNVKNILISGQNTEFALLKKIHAYYLSDYKTEINDNNDVKARIVEKSLWQSYEPQQINYSPFIAHYWTLKGGNTETKYNLFFTTLYPKLAVDKLLLYISIILLIAIIGNLLVPSFFGTCEVIIGIGDPFTAVKLGIFFGLVCNILFYMLGRNS